MYSFSGDELDGSKKVIVELREMWRGQYFGELAIINKTPRTASVVSKTPVALLVLRCAAMHVYKYERMYVCVCDPYRGLLSSSDTDCFSPQQRLRCEQHTHITTIHACWQTEVLTLRVCAAGVA